jgi:DNA-binding NarL/FixJ family response regulator
VERAGTAQRRSDIKVIYLTQNREPRIAAEAFRRKASGYLLKDSAASELTAAIRAALQGRRYVSPSIADTMTDAGLRPDLQDATLRDLVQPHFEAANIDAARGEVDTEVADVQTGDFRRALSDAARRRPDAGEEASDRRPSRYRALGGGWQT